MGGLIVGVVVEIYGLVRVLGGRGVIDVCRNRDAVVGNIGALGTIRIVVLIVREAVMSGLTGYLFQGKYGCGWCGLTLGRGIEGGGYILEIRSGFAMPVEASHFRRLGKVGRGREVEEGLFLVTSSLGVRRDEFVRLML